MQHGDAALRAQLPQLVLELARLAHRLVDKRFDQWLTERHQLAAAVAAEKALHPGKTNSVDLLRLFAEHGHAGLVEDARDLFGLAAFIIVIAEHAEHGD